MSPTERGDDGLLPQLLGEMEVAEADQEGEDPRGLFALEALDVHHA